MKTLFKTTAAALAMSAALTTPAEAATVICSGTIGTVAMNADGTLVLQMGTLGPFLMCGTASSLGSIPVDTCRGWYSQMLAAFALRKTIAVYFDTTHVNNTSMASTCTASDFNWNARTPYHIQLTN